MKIVKFFVVFNLILSISLINSVAAISVSDGSAFVTKAEFAADLNNLSNRMSTLENSLDAKIDSLVSSYLSRNGIWNGETQIINKNTSQYGDTYTYFRAIMGLGAGDAALSSGTTWYSNLGNRNTVDSRNIYPFKPYGSNQHYTVIDNFTKSGLLCVNFRNEYMLGTPYNKSTKTYKDNSSSGQGGIYSKSSEWSYGFSCPFTWTFYEWTKDDKQVGNALSVYSEVFSTINASIPNYARIVFTNNYGSWYAFVNKENKLVLTSSDFSDHKELFNRSSDCQYGISKTVDDAASGFNKVGLSCMYSVYSASIY